MAGLTETDELRHMLDERGVEWEAFDDFEQTTQWSTHNGAFVYWARERDGKLLVETTAPTKCSVSCTPAQAIAATLESDGEYERKMDSLLCRLTNGLFSKTRAYSLDFMESCVEEAFEAGNARQTSTTHAVIVSDESTDYATGHCECELCGQPIDPWDRFCRHCGAKVVTNG